MSGSLVIKINGDVQNYQSALKEAEQQTKALSDKASAVAKQATVAFAGLSAAVFGVTSAYRVQEQAEIRTAQTIKATGGAAGLSAKEIFNMASALQEVTTFGDEAIIGGQNLLLTFRNIGKDVFPRATEIMLDMSEAMGTDMKSSAIQLGKALNDPVAGISALNRVGITFSDQQKEQIKLFQQTGQTAKAQGIILKELEMQFGGVARASAGGTGELIQVKNIIGDVAEEIGKNMLPVLLTIARPLKQFFLFFQRNKDLAKTAATVLAIGTALTGTVAIVATSVVAFLKLRSVMIAASVAVKAMTFSIRGLVGATGIGLLLILVTDLALNWEKRLTQMQDIFTNFTARVTKLASGLGNILAGIFTLDLEQLKKGLAEAKASIIGTMDEISNSEAFTDPEKDPLKKIFPGEDKVKEQAAVSTEAILAAQAEQQALLDEQKKMQREERLEREKTQFEEEMEILNDQSTVETEAKREHQLETARADRAEKKQVIKDEIKHGKVMAQIKKIQRSAEFQGTKQGFAELEQLTQSSNNTLKSIGKVAAIANITIKTAESAMNIFNGFSTIPIIGPALGIAGAAAAVAFGAERIGKINSANAGGRIGGNLLSPNRDSVLSVLTPGEFVTPRNNYEETVEAVADSRLRERGENAGNADVTVSVMYESDEAEKIMTAQQTEADFLGTSTSGRAA